MASLKMTFRKSKAYKEQCLKKKKKKFEYLEWHEEDENVSWSRKTNNCEVNQATFVRFKRMWEMNAHVSCPY